MSGELTPLHRLLRRVAWRRQWARLLIATLTATALGCTTLLVLFFLDWAWQPSREIRLIGLIIAAICATFGLVRYALPWLRYRESELDIAILIEKHQNIDSDLVAALQFERPEAARWGSLELEREVIRRVGELAKNLPLIHDAPWTPLRRRAIATIVEVAVLALVWLFFPEHLRTFHRRLLLEDVPYPTATRVVAVFINGQPVFWEKGQAVVGCPVGQQVVITVAAQGYLPPQGTVVLAPRDSRRVHVEQPLPQLAATATTVVSGINLPVPKAGQLYQTQISALRETICIRIRIGDAATNWITLDCLQRPAVTLLSYAEDPRDPGNSAVLRGATHLTVWEGSRLTLGVESDRPLKRVLARLDRLERPLEKSWPPSVPPPQEVVAFTNVASEVSHDDAAFSERQHSQKEVWWLDPAGLPLAELTAPQRVVFEIVDRNGLPVDPPLEASILIRPDYPPQLTARTLTRFVLPTAQPTLVCQVRDDFALEKVTVQAHVIHPDGADEPPVTWTVWQKSAAVTKVLDEKWKIDLTPLACRKGDRVEIVVTATDYRRPGQEGAATSTEPIILEVTDLAGILALMSEIDRQSAEHLKEMIDKQLDVGGGP